MASPGAAEAMQEASDELQGCQVDIFDYVCERWRRRVLHHRRAAGRAGNASSTALQALEKKDLRRRPACAAGPGGRPQLLWVPPPLPGKRETRETMTARVNKRACSLFY